jgi:TetR/AcrR family transcriptional regulator, transcriptional repressor for nem operon
MAADPKTERGRRSRERIVSAADVLVTRRGATGMSLDEVLADAGASKSQLYHYFSDKDDLIRAVIAWRREHHLGRQLPLLERLDSWDAIGEWFEMTVDMQRAWGFSGCPIGTLASELADRDDRARDALCECLATWQGYLRRGLERMRARGVLVESADPAELATAAFATMQGGLLLAKTSKDPRPLRIALGAATDYLRTFASATD